MTPPIPKKMRTTLNKIRQRRPFSEDWRRLLRSLGKRKADDCPLSIITILNNTGLDNALWCLRAVDGHQREIRLYAVWCARQVQHLMSDPRSIAMLDVAERFANGEASQEEMTIAGVESKKAIEEVTQAGEIAYSALSTAVWLAWDDIWELAGAAAAAASSAYAVAGTSAGPMALAEAIAAQEARLREVCAKCERTGSTTE